MSGVPEGHLGGYFVSQLGEATKHRILDVGLANAEHNAPFIAEGRSIRDLRGQAIGEGNSAIVIAAGPSIKEHDPIKAIKESGYKGMIIAAESAMAYCLRHDVVPDLVVTLDPNHTRVVRWFGDPTLTKESLAQDDYFRRQDMDETFANELATNAEMLALMDKHGKKIRMAMSSSASPAVVQRALDTGMEIYWWNPMYDDPSDRDGITAKLARSNRLPCVNTGGNVGTAAWMFGWSVMEKQAVALTGVDFGYYATTSYVQTQYYHEIVDLVGEDRLADVFMHIHNPHLGKDFYTDPAYMWYCEVFREMAMDADCDTYNCTEGGILFGDPIKFVPLSTFLSEFK